MELLEKIKEELVNYHRLTRAKEHMEQIMIEIEAKSTQRQALIDQLGDAYEDYEKLEGLSLKSMFHTVLGSKEKQMEKERQTYLQLSGELEELTESIQLLRFEQEVLSKRLKDYDVSAKRLDTLKKQREHHLISQGGRLGKELVALTVMVDDLHRLTSDIKEAHIEGEQLINMLHKMSSVLSRVRQWGRFPSQGSRGLHRYAGIIDQARKMSHRVQHQLTKFNRELRDVYPHADPNFITFDFERYDNFFLMFFDNLISDWIIQQRIVNTKHQVDAFLDRVTRIMQSLQHESQNVENSLTQCQRRHEEILLGE